MPSSDPSTAADRAAVAEALALLAEAQQAFAVSFYARFFEAHPEVVPLFGAHSESEREEMMNETLNSLAAWCDDEPWLLGNLEAMGGESHWEYGVSSQMYDGFHGVFQDCAREQLGSDWNGGLAAALAAALEAICLIMRQAGERAAARARERGQRADDSA